MTKQICPHCNGFLPLRIHCPACDTPMADCGTLQEALGPYVPYEENSLVHAQFDCVHQVFCSSCNVEYFYTIPQDCFSDH